MKQYSAMMFVIDPTMGPNAEAWGILCGIKRFEYTFVARNEEEARKICDDFHLIYSGEVIASYDAGDDFDWLVDDDPADWWK